ncbi:MAG TPA: hypothetical protein ENG70_01310 [Candidatus Cloacimonetes bacterium]|nr:hypothetical protein [Candidatus Cloacimonadota bacterium]HEX37488.1 hypothetical protein [Candidatus Cloacimonadota bacterium]
MLFVCISLPILLFTSCSQMSISEKTPFPNSVSYMKTIHLPISPRKIRYCSYTNTFLAIDDIKNYIYRIDIQGKITQRIGEFGFEKGQFVHISDIAVNDFGNIFVVDDVENLIIQFDELGQYVNSFEPMDVSEPELIAVQNTGEILVYDSNANQVVCFSRANNIRFRFGKFELVDPFKIAPSMNVNYIADHGTNSVFLIDTFGGLLSEINVEYPLIDISTSKSIYFIIDNRTNLFIARKTSDQLLELGPLNILAPLKNIKAIVALQSQIAVLDSTTLVIFQLVTN